jgi:hypothetical protein
MQVLVNAVEVAALQTTGVGLIAAHEGELWLTNTGGTQSLDLRASATTINGNTGWSGTFNDQAGNPHTVVNGWVCS